MSLELARHPEAFQANFTFLWTLSCVNPKMNLESRRVLALFAKYTLEWAFLSMNSKMTLETEGFSEALFAKVRICKVVGSHQCELGGVS